MVLIRVWEIFVWTFQGCEGHGVLGALLCLTWDPPCFGYVFFFARGWIQVLSWMNLDEIQYECARLSRLFIWINMWCCTSPSVLRCYDYVFFYVEHDCFKFKFLIWLPKMFATICICVIQIFKWQIQLFLTHFDFYSVSHLESPPLPKKANINCHLSLTVLPTTCIYMSTSLVLPTHTCQLTVFCCHMSFPSSLCVKGGLASFPGRPKIAGDLHFGYLAAKDGFRISTCQGRVKGSKKGKTIENSTQNLPFNFSWVFYWKKDRFFWDKSGMIILWKLLVHPVPQRGR